MAATIIEETDSLTTTGNDEIGDTGLGKEEQKHRFVVRGTCLI